MARTSEYTEELALRICERVSEGESIKEICESEDMPARSTVRRWIRTFAEFRTMVDEARKEHAQAEFERMLAEVDEPPERDEKGKIDMGWVQNQRVRLDARKWILGRMDTRRFGDRQEIVGAGGEPLIPDPLSHLSTEQRELEMARRIAFLLNKAAAAEPPAPPLQLTNEPTAAVVPSPAAEPTVDLYGKPITHYRMGPHEPIGTDLYGKPIYKPWN